MLVLDMATRQRRKLGTGHRQHRHPQRFPKVAGIDPNQQYVCHLTTHRLDEQTLLYYWLVLTFWKNMHRRSTSHFRSQGQPPTTREELPQETRAPQANDAPEASKTQPCASVNKLFDAPSLEAQAAILRIYFSHEECAYPSF